MKLRIIVGVGVAVSMVFGATVPVVEVPEHYYVRQGPSNEAQFSEVERNLDISQLIEAHIIGTACYNEFRAKGQKTIRERTDCDEHFARRDVPNFPMPSMEGRTWIG